MSDAREILTATVFVLAMGVSAWTGYCRSRSGAWTLLLLSIAWFTVAQPWEGPTLLTVSEEDRRGLTASDIVGLVGTVTALVLLRRGVRGASPAESLHDRDNAGATGRSGSTE